MRQVPIVSASQARFRIADDSSDASHSFSAAVSPSQCLRVPARAFGICPAPSIWDGDQRIFSGLGRLSS